MTRRPPKKRRAPLRDLADLSAALDRDAAFALVRAFGGTSVYVPEKAQPGQKLWEALGPKLAAVMTELWGGDYIMVPLAGTGSAAARRRAILGDPRSGSEVARAYGVHQKSVYRLWGKARRRPEGAQLDFFPTPPKR